MAGANDKNQEITKKVFGGDAGKQGALFRELFEVLILEREEFMNPDSLEHEINLVQQTEIDKRIESAKQINRAICNELGVLPLEDMKPEETIEEPIL